MKFSTSFSKIVLLPILFAVGITCEKTADKQQAYDKYSDAVEDKGWSTAGISAESFYGTGETKIPGNECTGLTTAKDCKNNPYCSFNNEKCNVKSSDPTGSPSGSGVRTGTGELRTSENECTGLTTAKDCENNPYCSFNKLKGCIVATGFTTVRPSGGTTGSPSGSPSGSGSATGSATGSGSGSHTGVRTGTTIGTRTGETKSPDKKCNAITDPYFCNNHQQKNCFVVEFPDDNNLMTFQECMSTSKVPKCMDCSKACHHMKISDVEHCNKFCMINGDCRTYNGDEKACGGECVYDLGTKSCSINVNQFMTCKEIPMHKNKGASSAYEPKGFNK